jgi:plasmid maintenance system antidote protein VapI
MRLESYLKLAGKSVIKAASELGVTRQRVYQIIKGDRASPELAEKIEKWSDGAVQREELLYPNQAA